MGQDTLGREPALTPAAPGTPLCSPPRSFDHFDSICAVIQIFANKQAVHSNIEENITIILVTFLIAKKYSSNKSAIDYGFEDDRIYKPFSILLSRSWAASLCWVTFPRAAMLTS